jgi:hypothetical protein
MIFWLVYLFLIGFLIVSAVVVFKAGMSGPSKLIHILIAVMLVYGFYKIKYPTYTYRYRMTVAVDAGGETRSASSVIEVTATRVPQFLPEVLPYERSAWGQAIFIDLPDGKNIVALLAAGPTAMEPFVYPIIPRAFRPSKYKGINVDEVPELRGRRELTKEQMPTLVTVTDPTDARTARVVNVDDLGGTLGVHLRSISVEMTKDAVTPIDMERHLPFLNKLCEGRAGYWGYGGIFTPNCLYFVMR